MRKVKFGTRKADVVEAPSGDYAPYLRNLKAGDTTVRFLENPDDWIAYKEHFIEKSSFPCTQDETCKGCLEENKAKRKYATNVYLVDHNIVLPFKLPVTLAKKLFLRAERNDGVVTDRDFILIRQGQGLDTEYDVDPDDRSKRDIATLSEQSQDIEEILAGVYEEVWGDSEEKEATSKEEDTVPPWDKEELDEDDVRKMTRGNLVKLAKKHKIKFDEDGSKADIVEAILGAAG